jgi:hypothetical protein
VLASSRLPGLMSGSPLKTLRVTTTFGFQPMDVYCNQSGSQSKRKRVS